MLIELLCRFDRQLSPEELKDFNIEADTQSLMHGSDFDLDVFKEDYLTENKLQYEHLRCTICLDKVRGFNEAEVGYTCVRYYDGSAFTFKIDYDVFKALYGKLTEKPIFQINDSN